MKHDILLAEGVTSDHAKASRRSNGRGRVVTVGASGSVVTDTIKVVGVLHSQGQSKKGSSERPKDQYQETHDSQELDQLKLAVTILVVQLRLPVLTLVNGERAGGLLRVPSILVGSGEAKVGATSHGVNVRADLARENDGIGSLHGKRSTLDDEDAAALGLSRGGKGGS